MSCIAILGFRSKRVCRILEIVWQNSPTATTLIHRTMLTCHNLRIMSSVTHASLPGL
jgi:hypothetical protein